MNIINNSLIIIYPETRLDIQTSEEFEETVYKILQDYPNHNLLIDLTKVDLVSSTSIRTFISIMRFLKTKNLNLKLVNANPLCKRVIDIVNLSKILEVYDTVEEAIESF